MAEVSTVYSYAVVEASDGPTGLKLAGELDRDVVVLDLALSGRSGVQVLNQLKDRRPTREIPVVVVSAYALLLFGDDTSRVDGMISNPFELPDRLAHVSRVSHSSEREDRPALSDARNPYEVG